MIIAFELSAFLTFVASVLAATLQGDLNLFKASRFKDSTRRFWIKVLDRLILGLSDQQLISGISIMIIGYIKLCSIATYHVYVIQSLAMFSSSAHLASVTSLRRYFQDHPAVARIRIVCMLVFALLLSATLLMLGTGVPKNIGIGAPNNVGNGSSRSLGTQCPMLCYLDHQRHFTVDQSLGIVMVLLLVLSYWSALAYVFPNANVVFTTWLLTRPLITVEALLQAIPGGNHGHQFHERFMHSKLWFPSLYVTFSCQSSWWLISFIFSIVIRATKRPATDGSEEGWGFGQILALLMMALPLLSAIEVFFGTFESKARNISIPREKSDGI